MAGSNGTKRMSAEEKRKVILSIYHKTKSVYTEKEVVTLASKAGVNANTIVDINNSLIDDGLVDKEKIGGSNYFWSFPAKQDRMKQIKYQDTLKEIEQLRKSTQDALHQLQDAKRGRTDDDDGETDGEDAKAGSDKDGEGKGSTEALVAGEKQKGIGRRAQKLLRLQQIEKERDELQKELDSLRENDPQALADLQHELRLVQEAANRWTDNVFECQSYLVKKRGMVKKDVQRILGISSAFDYPEDKIPK